MGDNHPCVIVANYAKEGELMRKVSLAAQNADPITFRCPNCNRLLFKGCIKYVEIKCPRCGHIQCMEANDFNWYNANVSCRQSHIK